MKLRTILTLLAAVLAGPGQAQHVLPPGRGDDALLEMAKAFERNDRARLAQLLPEVHGHALEPWAAYWELRARLETATPQEVQEFLTRYAGTYQEDRLRNDWLLQLGLRRDWATFAQEYPRFRMNDDPQVRCYALAVQQQREGASPALAEEVRRLWFAQRDPEDACTLAARGLVGEVGRGRLAEADVWRKARLATEHNRPQAAAAAVEMVEPEALSGLKELNASPTKFLTSRVFAASRTRKELVVLALIRLASSDSEKAAAQLENKWGPMLSPEERNWVWGAIGKQAATRLEPEAAGYYARVSRDSDLSDDMLAWKVRAALRTAGGPQWKSILAATDAMSEELRREPAWTYWRARALMGVGGDDRREESRRLLAALASPRGFYEQLALEELGHRIVLPARPAPLTDEEREAARLNPGLARGLQAIALGLRPEGVREWNYTTNLHRPGGMNDRELLAAAQLACDSQVWDRCINTSERTKVEFDVQQRFPTPHQASVVRRSQDIGLDPAYVYGLIRQESRFVTDARSHVGASGLMQVMPGTARWTARRIGLQGFKVDQLNDRETNIAIGTGYLKLVLDDFGGSMPLAAAAYNAGPSRPRAWRNGPVMDAAAWAENVPFGETRDYVKKVLANTTAYAALLTGQPQSLKARLGSVGPRDASLPEPSADLP
ncbi:lytic transglycosylase domain-containing protein [Ramlibacter tataouinensis]|uniref:Peptidoglycan lytic transglycosylase, Glycoside Hydrolase Family 23-like protein n=1 Tax=Ramlibacter tataouinensis (strain ATCC BAA-407 / DSM 14655 / LMG 21543 / TTB310) TaxID=365046 RepID=F5XXM1_RAMTT|nr:lytic transglycosylase domain-containing protein [Ramlibacter tataouinensis]AEG91824.1 peptidoglycan lytic transglycosylase, Glycoside Hydrolase Family 23-like protein [Ramlibacter tataouinensis TTB310]